MAYPKLIAPAKRLLEKGEVVCQGFAGHTYRAFEANIDFEIRFMADTKVVGCNWIELPVKKYKIRSATDKGEFDLKSRCQIEVCFSFYIYSHIWPPFFSPFGYRKLLELVSICNSLNNSEGMTLIRKE